MNFLIVFFVAMLGIGGNTAKEQPSELKVQQVTTPTAFNYVEGDTFCDVEAHEKKLEALRNPKNTLDFSVNASIANDTSADLCDGSKVMPSPQ